MRLLDLYCGAGGAAMGYHRAGFDEIVGVDIAPQKNYPFTFVESDAIEYAEQYGWRFDVIHASPPCQLFSNATPVKYRARHKNWITPTREAIAALGKPYVIENVPGARKELYMPIRLCGSMFGLPIRRHRYFETLPQLEVPMECDHHGPIVYISGSTGNSNSTFRRRDASKAQKVAAIDIDWMVTKELDQAIPPAYTEWIGRQILGLLQGEIRE